MIKVAMIGAGSVVFSRNLTGDILSFPEFRNATFSYMDIDADRLDVGARLCRKLATALGADPKIEATPSRRKALEGADFVINMVQIGGFDSTLVDFEIPRKYGLNFTIADTTGPGGFFRAMRTFPMLKGLAQDMMELCPKAVLINYSNPMSMNMQSIFRTSTIQAVGLCHSVQGTFDQLMRYISIEPREASFICAGINHMAFFLKLEKDGQDLYPRLFEAAKDPEIYNTNKVRFELMKRLGYFVTESSEHNAEYNAWFIPRGPKTISRYSVPIDEYLRRCDGIVDEFARMKSFARSEEQYEKRQVHKSHEYGSNIIHSIVTGEPRVVYGNMVNNGAISNLPKDAIAEAPTLVDRSGLHFTTVGELPPQIIGYVTPHVVQHELFIRAATEGRRDAVYQAAMMDPLTAATLSIDQIVEMCDELIAGHGDLLPNLDAKKTLVPTSGITFPLVNPKDLRASWEAQQRKAFEDSIMKWHVVGPFKGESRKVTLDFATPVDEAFARSKDGAVDLKATYRHRDQTLSWKPVSADKQGFVDLARDLAAEQWCVAYAYAEIESVHAREALMRCGSDDGIRVWINGQLVHNNEIGRAYTAGCDQAMVHLRAGINRILVKIDNYVGGWGFGVSIPKPNF